MRIWKLVFAAVVVSILPSGNEAREFSDEPKFHCGYIAREIDLPCRRAGVSANQPIGLRSIEISWAAVAYIPSAHKNLSRDGVLAFDLDLHGAELLPPLLVWEDRLPHQRHRVEFCDQCGKPRICLRGVHLHVVVVEMQKEVFGRNAPYILRFYPDLISEVPIFNARLFLQSTLDLNPRSVLLEGGLERDSVGLSRLPDSKPRLNGRADGGTGRRASFAQGSPDKDHAYHRRNQSGNGNIKNSERPRGHVLLGLQIILGCCTVLCGIYGVRETSKPLRKSFFRDGIEAETYALLSFAAIVIGGALALLSLLVLIF